MGEDVLASSRNDGGNVTIAAISKSDFAELTCAGEAALQRAALAPRDAAAIDQMEAGLRDIWTALGIEHTPGAIASLVALRAMEERMRVLLRDVHPSAETAAALEHLLQEMRMVLAWAAA